MEPDDARALLSHAQRLGDEARLDGTSVAGVVAAVVGLQAQDLHAASLQIAVREYADSRGIRPRPEQPPEPPPPDPEPPSGGGPEPAPA